MRLTGGTEFLNDPGDHARDRQVGTPPLAVTAALLAVAGWVDAVGYLQFGHLFVSFMSGNTTQMAVNLGRAAWSEAGPIGVLIALFVLGVFCGTLSAHVAGKWQVPVVLGVEVSLLVTALLLPAPAGALPLAALPVVLAMGWQNAALERVGTRKVSLTYVTGTLVACGRELAEAVTGQGERWAWSGDALLWLAMASGAVAGAASFAAFGFRSLAVPAVAVLVLAGTKTVAVVAGKRR